MRAMITDAAAGSVGPVASSPALHGAAWTATPFWDCTDESWSSFDWPVHFRRLSIRHECRADIHLAFTTLAYTVICSRQIKRFCP